MKGASDFQDGMAKISTLVDTSKVNMDDLSKSFMKLSNETGRSVTELAEAGYQALSASVDPAKLEDFTQTAVNLAKVGFTDTTTAVDVLTTAMNAYGKSAGTADKIANRLVKTQNKGKTTVNELASSMGKIIPTASAMNVNMDNLSAIYVQLTKQGIATAEATTYANSMLNELGDSGTTVGKILKQKTGQSFQELMGSGKSVADVLSILQAESERTGTNFNELWGSSEAGKSALALLNGGVDEFNDAVSEMADNTDVLSEGLDKLHTPAETLKETLNRIKNIGIMLGGVLIEMIAPALDSVAEYVEKASNWFGSLSDETKKNIGMFLLLIAGLSPVLGLLGTFFNVISGGITFVKSLGSGLGLLWGVISANPIGACITLLIGMVGYIIYLWNTSEEFRASVKQIWNSVKQAFTECCQAFGENVSLWVEFFSAIWQGASKSLTSIGDKFSKVWDDATTKTANFFINLSESFESGLSNVWNTVTTTLGNIKQEFINIFENVKSTVQGAIDYVKGLFDFEWSLPKPKLPHFSISGSFSLMPPSVPTIGINWYRKAMNEPYMFTDPTIFGMNPFTGEAKGAGEAGDEIMYGRNNLMHDIREAVGGSDYSVIESIMSKIFDLLMEYLPQLLNRKLVTDTGVLAGELVPIIDEELGYIVARR